MPEKENLLERYKSIRQILPDYCKPLNTEDYIPQAAEFVSPPKWNLAHTSWFFEEFILKPFSRNYSLFHTEFGYLFNSYYQGVGDRMARFSRGLVTRPTVDEIYKYREFVDSHMHSLLEGKISPELETLVILGLNHEQQHQELFLSDLKYTFSLNPLYPDYNKVALCETGKAGPSEFHSIKEGIHEIGYSGKDFSYDNELSKHRVFLEAYQIRKNLVSNLEYLEFIEDNGYQRNKLWHDEGWTWLTETGVSSPLYWTNRNEIWHQYTLAGLKEIKANNPVTHINYFEAFAFAQWKGCRLPTEFEWEVAADSLNWGDRWEWTESAHLPYPGYKKAEGTVGEYNGKFMVNQKVLRGASVATPKGHERKTYRNFFHPNMSWQFNGIRLAK